MAFEQKNWYDKDENGNVPEGAPAINADNLNRIENGIKENEKIAKNNTDKVNYLSRLIPQPLYLAFAGNVNANMMAAAFGKGNEDNIIGIGRALAMYANSKGETENIDFLLPYDKYSDIINYHKYDLIRTPTILSLINSSPYALNLLKNTSTALPDIVLYNSGETEYLDIENASITTDYIDQNYQKLGWSFASNVNTNGNISITKTVMTNATSVTAFVYSIPLLKQLPDLTGYKTLHIKLSDTEKSSVEYNYGNSSFSIRISNNTTTINPDEQGSNGNVDYFSNKERTFDKFSAYATNPTSSNVTISLNFGSFSTNNTYKREATMRVHIDKIWISEG